MFLQHYFSFFCFYVSFSFHYVLLFQKNVPAAPESTIRPYTSARRKNHCQRKILQWHCIFSVYGGAVRKLPISEIRLPKRPLQFLQGIDAIGGLPGLPVAPVHFIIHGAVDDIERIRREDLAEKQKVLPLSIKTGFRKKYSRIFLKIAQDFAVKCLITFLRKLRQGRNIA